MRIRAYSVFLFYCLLIVVTAGCSSKSGVIQTSNSTPPAGSPQQSAPVPGEAAATERGRGEAAEEEEGAPPEPVSGIGDEAFWTGGRVGGALYVLKGNAFIRISVGGPGDEAAKIEKLKALARKALPRL